MAVAEQAALLDVLMGKGRNVSLSEAKPPHWSDDDICKHFLAGLCPNDLFNNTKDDLGPCEKIHDDALFDAYSKSKRSGKMRYEEKLCIYLRELISSVESRIRRGETRLQKNGNLVHSFYNCEREETLGELTVKIEEALCKVEKLGTEGEVQQSRVWLDVAEQLKNDKSRIERTIEIYNQQAKELEICQTCGAFQVKGDAHQRIEEHLQGKSHLGYAKIREYLASQALEKNRLSKERLDKDDKERINRDDKDQVNKEDTDCVSRDDKDRANRNEKDRTNRDEKDRVSRDTRDRISRNDKDRNNRDKKDQFNKNEKDRLSRDDDDRMSRIDKDRRIEGDRVSRDNKVKRSKSRENRKDLDKDRKRKSSSFRRDYHSDKHSRREDSSDRHTSSKRKSKSPRRHSRK